MAPRGQVSTLDASEVDFATEHNIAPEKPTTINRKVAKAPKKRSVTMKKPTATTKAKSKREALKDRTNLQDGTDGEEEDANEAPAKKRSRKSKTVEDEEEPKTKKVKTVKSASDKESSEAAVAKPIVTKKAAPKKRVASTEALRMIPETQPVEEDVSQSIEVEEESELPNAPEVLPPVTVHQHKRQRSTSQQPQAPQYVRARSTSQQPRAFSREGSAALADRRLADAEARRKLTEMTSKYEDMRLRYESLSELGNSTAESNFDKLKRATDERAKSAAELIASLKKELSESRKSTSTNTAENAKLQTQIGSLQTSNEESQSQVKELRDNLTEARNEVKSLTAKLEATREAARKAAAAAAVEAAKTPGSAIKSRDTAGVRNNISGSNLDGTKQAALKEELYRDLTGLIINSVKRKDGEDEYSCIQTGRNGSESLPSSYIYQR